MNEQIHNPLLGGVGNHPGDGFNIKKEDLR
jgi:hypothetical protein